MIYPTVILQNMTTGRFHPVPFRTAPMPGGADSALAAQRYKSVGHHTAGFYTIEEARAYISTKHDPASDSTMIDTGLVEPWDGIETPAGVQFFDVAKLLKDHKAKAIPLSGPIQRLPRIHDLGAGWRVAFCPDGGAMIYSDTDRISLPADSVARLCAIAKADGAG